MGVNAQQPDTGYDDIEKLNNGQNDLYNKAYEQQQGIVNMQTQQSIDEINRNKDKLNAETTKQNQGLYTDYTKQVNPYGATAEGLATDGLSGSGAAESTKKNIYNNYQNNRTETLNNAKTLLADYDAKITEARTTGNIQLAQFALESYKQKMDNLYKNYQLVQDQKKFEYQQGRDQVGDNQWQQQFDYNKNTDDRNYDYQVGRDQVGDNQWNQQFDYNKNTDDRNYNYQVGRDNVTDSQWQREFGLAKKKASANAGGGITIGNSNSNDNVSKIQDTIKAGDNILNKFGNTKVSDQMIASALKAQVENGSITEEQAREIINNVR